MDLLEQIRRAFDRLVLLHVHEHETGLTRGDQITRFIDDLKIKFDLDHGFFPQDGSYCEQIVIFCRFDEVDSHVQNRKHDPGSFKAFVANSQIAKPFNSAYFKILGIIAVVNVTHLVSLPVTNPYFSLVSDQKFVI